ncbi:MAG: FkbM family methyltransferase [Magnetospirillum sp.]|nr:FkbM family methyltransferase [Magnetospirillum sp.]
MGTVADSAPDDDVVVRMVDGTAIVVPADLGQISTYVFLEQEDWFEKELPFVRRFLTAGMRAIDIGANHGAYSLPMARLVGAAGQVWSYEPQATTAARLRRGMAANGRLAMTVVEAAIADTCGTATLSDGRSELVALAGAGGVGQDTAVTTLDHEDSIRGWGSPDFVKIDAEGAEPRVIDGGRDFFARHSPLVMVEVRAGDTVDLTAMRKLQDLGYAVYRLNPDPPVLVPQSLDEPFDPFELNLFACKADRAAGLAAARLLTERVVVPAPADGIAALRPHPFAALQADMLDQAESGEWRTVLDCYAAAQEGTRGLAGRIGALHAALAAARREVARQPSPARLMTLARIAAAGGARRLAVNALRAVLDIAKGGPLRLDVPFWPAHPGMDAESPGDAPGLWLLAGCAIAAERLSAYSGYILAPGPLTKGLLRTPYCPPDIERRVSLAAAVRGEGFVLTSRLANPGPGHINARLWREWLGPNFAQGGR